MSKQTAVEWFWNQLPEILPFSIDTETAVKLQEAMQQSKAMEREQIVEAFQTEWSQHNYSGEQYYANTYGKEAGHES